MKLNKLTFCPAVIGLVSLASVAHASIDIVNNLPPTAAGIGAYSSFGSPYKAQDFYTGSGSGAIGVIDTAQLYLNVAAGGVNAVLNVYLYNATAGGPTGSSILLGTVTPTAAGLNTYSVVINNSYNTAINAASYYAIALDITAGGLGNVGWEYAAPGSLSTGIGAFANTYASSDQGGTWGVNASGPSMMDISVTPVPEPITQAMIIFGSVIGLVSVGRWGLVRLKGAKGAGCTVNA